jgi:hypothetical protein
MIEGNVTSASFGVSMQRAILRVATFIIRIWAKLSSSGKNCRKKIAPN